MTHVGGLKNRTVGKDPRSAEYLSFLETGADRWTP
jgi:hypothetical protein